MPTNQRYWEGTDDVSSSELIADITIWASTNAKAANQAFNITNGDYLCWKYFWPRLAKCFGADASSKQVFAKDVPKEGSLQLDLSLGEWSQGKQEVWERICDRAGTPGKSSRRTPCPRLKVPSAGAKATWFVASDNCCKLWLICRILGRSARGISRIVSMSCPLFVYALMLQVGVFQRTWSATLSMNKARKYGWTKSVDSYDNFKNTFAKFSSLGLIPKGVLEV